MPTREGPAHVVTTKRSYKGRLYETHLLRRTYREGDKVHNVTLANLSHLPAHLVDLIRRGLKGEQFVAAQDSFKILSTRSHGHVVAVLGTIRRLELDAIIGRKVHRNRQLTLAMIAARIIEPQSKLATSRSLRTTTLPEELGFEEADEDDLYGAMDWVHERQGKVEAELSRRHLKDGELTLYDVTSTYFEGRCCPIAFLGHNRDGKKDKLQVVFGLLTNAEGCPVAVQVFAGNTGDPKTLAAQIKKVREDFGLSQVTLVGDRGMITSARIREDLKGVEGLSWISALRAPQIQKLRESGAIQVEVFDERNLAEIHDPSYPGERLVVCRNPLLTEERRRKREDLLRATEKELAKVAARVKAGKLKDRAKIGLRVGKVIGRFKVKKLLKLRIADKTFRFERNQERIEREAALDGFYVIRTSVRKSQLSAEATVRAYKSLAKIERAFRNMKSMNEKVRPVYHWTEKRVRAHIFICMLAHYVQWHMETALSPLLFVDEELEDLSLRKSPVTPAVRSESAKWKDSSKRALDGKPVHSFRTLLRELSTIARNKVRSHQAEKATFNLLTEPSSYQRHVFKLLGVTLTL